MDERDLLLIESNSEISMPNLAPPHAKDLLGIGLQLYSCDAKLTQRFKLHKIYGA